MAEVEPKSMIPLLLMGFVASLIAWRRLSKAELKAELDAKAEVYDLDFPLRRVRLFGGAKVDIQAHVTVRSNKSRWPDVKREATAVVMRLLGFWGLRFKSPDEAMAPESVSSLEDALMAIDTDRFAVRAAVVYDVSPVDTETDEEPPEESPVEKMRRKYSDMAEVIDAINQCFEAMEKDHPKVVNDPDLASRLKEEIKADKERATFADRPTWSRRRYSERRRYRV